MHFISYLIEFLFHFFSKSDLNLSNNQLNKLPDEFADLTHLLRLDISHNLFLSLPKVVFKMPKLRQLKANNNAIIGKNYPIYTRVNNNILYRSFSFQFRFWVHFRYRNRRNHHNRFYGSSRFTKESVNTSMFRSIEKCSSYFSYNVAWASIRRLGRFVRLMQSNLKISYDLNLDECVLVQCRSHKIVESYWICYTRISHIYLHKTMKNDEKRLRIINVDRFLLLSELNPSREKDFVWTSFMYTVYYILCDDCFSFSTIKFKTNQVLGIWYDNFIQVNRRFQIWNSFVSIHRHIHPIYIKLNISSYKYFD